MSPAAITSRKMSQIASRSVSVARRIFTLRNPKFQNPNPRETPTSKSQKSLSRPLPIDYPRLNIVWSLEIGIWHFRRQAAGSQKEPVKPSELKIETISSGAGRRDSTVSRFEYQWTASCHSCSKLTSGRRGMLWAAHHSLTVSSDRKSSMVAHVKMRLSHQCAAGTAKWATYGLKTGWLSFTSRVNGSPV